MNSKELAVEAPVEGSEDSVKRRILLRAAAKKAPTSPHFLPAGDAEASELITTLRRISLTPPRSAPKQHHSELEVRLKLCASMQAAELKSEPIVVEEAPKSPVTPLPRMKHVGPRLKQVGDIGTFRPPPDTDLAQAAGMVKEAAQRLTARHIGELRDMDLPGSDEIALCGSFLALFAEIDSRIDVTPSFQVLQSCSWETMQCYAQQPGHVIRMMRSVPDLVLNGRVTELAIQRAKSSLKPASDSSKPIWRTLYDFVTATIELYEVKKAAGLSRVQTYLKARSSSRTPLTSNQSTMRTMDETLPNISISLLSGDILADSFKRDTPSPREDKENSPFSTLRTPLQRGRDSATVREVQWKLDDLLRDFLRGKMIFSQKSFLSDLAGKKALFLGEFEARALCFADSLSADLHSQAVQPFLRTLAQGNVLEEVARLTLLLCPGPS